MKFKIIVHSVTSELEKEVNKYLKKHKNKIVSVTPVSDCEVHIVTGKNIEKKLQTYKDAIEVLTNEEY